MEKLTNELFLNNLSTNQPINLSTKQYPAITTPEGRSNKQITDIENSPSPTYQLINLSTCQPINLSTIQLSSSVPSSSS
jgi:hypothetical protein